MQQFNSDAESLSKITSTQTPKIRTLKLLHASIAMQQAISTTLLKGSTNKSSAAPLVTNQEQLAQAVAALLVALEESVTAADIPAELIEKALKGSTMHAMLFDC